MKKYLKKLETWVRTTPIYIVVPVFAVCVPPLLVLLGPPVVAIMWMYFMLLDFVFIWWDALWYSLAHMFKSLTTGGVKWI